MDRWEASRFVVSCAAPCPMIASRVERFVDPLSEKKKKKRQVAYLLARRPSYESFLLLAYSLL